MEYINTALSIAQNPKHTKWIAPLLLAIDAVFCGLIIWKIPYTEIDWSTYMQQVELYIKGERDYKKISGSTGPLVYPAAHVYIYRALYAVTDRGRDVRMAQWVFAGVYLGTLGLVLRCYRAAKAPPYILPLLILSKRMHSIFLLRCFNDCFAVLFLFAAIHCYQKKQWHLGTLLYTTGLNVKMSLLLPLPAIGLLALQDLGAREAITQAMIVFQVSVGYGYPFLHSHTLSYLSRAFELSRAFLYKWTVNYRFLPESFFLSPRFALLLLTTHIALLLLFTTTRWTKPSRRSLPQLLKLLTSPHEPRDQNQISRRIDARFVMTTLLTSMVIGMLCARSLHYQFYAYVGWASPFLLWRAGVNPVVLYVLWAVQEWAWNVYPSTPLSSGVVVAVLAVQVGGVWWGTRGEFEGERVDGDVDVDVDGVVGGPRVGGHEHVE